MLVELIHCLLFVFIVERQFREYVDPNFHTNPTEMADYQPTRRLSSTRSIESLSLQHALGGDKEEGQRHWNCLHPPEIADSDYSLPPLSEGAFVRKLRVPILLAITKVHFYVISIVFHLHSQSPLTGLN